MTTGLTPALTKEEWERVAAGSYQGHSLSEGQLGVPRGAEWINHEAMALANYNLPDDDPRKITMADVEAARGGADAACAEFPCDPDLIALESKLNTLAAKLAALLPVGQ
jgi:hypothetical protein